MTLNRFIPFFVFCIYVFDSAHLFFDIVNMFFDTVSM